MAELNDDLAGEYQLRSLFRADIADGHGHARFPGGEIAAREGKLTTQPRPPPAVDEPRVMLEHVRPAGTRVIGDQAATISLGEASGDIGLEVVLGKPAADETRHEDELVRVLAG